MIAIAQSCQMAHHGAIAPPEDVAIRRAIHIPRDTDFVTQVSQSH
jgi:hypothetical protein